VEGRKGWGDVRQFETQSPLSRQCHAVEAEGPSGIMNWWSRKPAGAIFRRSEWVSRGSLHLPADFPSASHEPFGPPTPGEQSFIETAEFSGSRERFQ